MRIWPISDLHLRQRDALDLWKPRGIPQADVCVVAGDVCDRFNLSVNWLAKVIRPHMPVVFVLGNHEFYDTDVVRARRNARFLCDAQGVHLLDDSDVVLDGVRFAGGTLWTDFQLGGADEEKVARAMDLARVSLADYGETRVLEGHAYRQMRPADTVAMHRETLRFLDGLDPAAMPTVVVTHHAPHPGSVHARYAEDPTTPAFVSDLGPMVDKMKPLAWIHGHVHSSFDYHVGEIRILCNPKGYRLENPDFEFSKVVEV